MAIILLLIGTFSMVMSFSPVSAVDTYWWLTIGYDPCPGMPEPDTAPTVGVHDYTVDSVINVTAPLIVNDTADTRWSFVNWTVTYPDNSTWSTTSNKFPITMDENKTAIAYYEVQYLLTVITPYDLPYIYDPGGSWHQEASRWFDANTANVKVGVLMGSADDYISLGTYARAYFINWTGDATGKIKDTYWHSEYFTMDGPKTAIAEWEVRYKLWTDPDSEYDPWGPGSNEYDPDERGWYKNCTFVDLTAPSVDNENVGNWRWRFDYWIVETWNGSAWVPETRTSENITVHLGQGKRATVYFYLQYYLKVRVSPSSLETTMDGQVIIGYSGYYDYCTNKTLTAADIIPDPSDSGIRWVFDRWYLAGVFDVYDVTCTVHIEDANCVGKTLYAIYTKEYHLIVQDNIGDLSGVSVQGCKWYVPGTVVNPLWAPCIVSIDSVSRYVFVEWVKDPGHYTDSSCNTTITMSGPRNATAYYNKEYKVTLNAVPQPPMEDKLAGFPKTFWWGANMNKWINAPSGPISDYPFDWYFDHWTVNGAGQTQFMNNIKINVTEPMYCVANYEGKSAFFITPQTVIKDAPAACTYFEVNVTAANLVDLYGVDFKVTWNPAYIELVEVDVEVDEIWTQYFIGMNDWNNTVGWYHLVATSLDGAPNNPYGFNGTHKIVKLKFHIIYDPCWKWTDYYVETPLTLTVISLADSNGHQVLPYNQHGGYYRINAIQPKIEMRPGLVIASEKDYVFTVEIWIVDAVKLHDWYADILFNTAHLDIIEVEIDTTFLTGPYEVFYYYKSDANGKIEIHICQQQPGETLAYGEGRLATLTFKVHDTIFWTTSNQILHSWIYFANVYISVKCPTYYQVPWWHLDIVNCEYKYIPIPGDVNMDGVVNVLDLQLVAADYGSTTTYDLNNDYHVDLIDLVLVAINYGRDTP